MVQSRGGRIRPQSAAVVREDLQAQQREVPKWMFWSEINFEKHERVEKNIVTIEPGRNYPHPTFPPKIMFMAHQHASPITWYLQGC